MSGRLYGVARRVVAGKYRDVRRLRNLIARLEAARPRSGCPAGDVEADSARDRLVAAVRCLKPAEREALQLVFWEQLSHAEAAEVLGCTANAVALRVHRAKAKLRDMLGAAECAVPSGVGGRPAPSGTGPPAPADLASSAACRPIRS